MQNPKIFKFYKPYTEFLYGLFWVSVSVFSGTMMYILAKDLLATQTQADCCYWWFIFALFFYVLYYAFSDNTFNIAVIKRYSAWITLFIILQISSTVLFFAGLKLVDPSISSFLQRSQIVFILVLAMVMLGERFSKGEWGSSFIIVAGLVLITFHTGQISITGSLFILGSTFLLSMSIIIVRKISSHTGSHTFALIRTITLLLFYVLYASFVPGSFKLLPIKTLTAVMAGAFFGPFLTVISGYKALEYMEAGKVALFGTTQPFFVMIGTFLLFGTYPGIKAIAGGMLMVFGNIIFIHLNIKNTAKKPAE